LLSLVVKWGRGGRRNWNRPKRCGDVSNDVEVAGSSLLLADAAAEDNSAAAAVPAPAPATPTPTAPPVKLCPSSPWSEVQLLITLSST